MIDRENQKRLVLIGIHRKGEKGFKKRFDKKEELKRDSLAPDSLPIAPEQVFSKNRSVNLIPE